MSKLCCGTNLFRSASLLEIFFAWYMQMSALVMENRTMAVKLHKTNTDPSVFASHKDGGSDKETFLGKHGPSTACTTKNKEEVTQLSPTEVLFDLFIFSLIG